MLYVSRGAAEADEVLKFLDDDDVGA